MIECLINRESWFKLDYVEKGEPQFVFKIPWFGRSEFGEYIKIGTQVSTNKKKFKLRFMSLIYLSIYFFKLSLL